MHSRARVLYVYALRVRVLVRVRACGLDGGNAGVCARARLRARETGDNFCVVFGRGGDGNERGGWEKAMGEGDEGRRRRRGDA